jgi:hypothetical protein
MSETLATRVKMSCVNTMGAEEHHQIANLIRASRIHIVDGDVAEAARDAMINHTHSLERNLDLVRLPASPVWFEWPLPPRNGRPHSGPGIARTGCLIAPHPEDDKLHMIVSAWEMDGVAMHAYGIGIIAQGDLDAVAAQARRLSSSSAEESISRIMSVIVAFVPPAFEDEMRIISDGEDQTMGALRDATADVPMMLSLLLLSASEGGAAFHEAEDDTVSVRMGDNYAPSTMLRISETVLGRWKPGFLRLGKKSVAWLNR